MSERLDILEWLKNNEEFILWNMEGWEDTGDEILVRESRRELQIVRDLKKMVEDSQEPDYRRKWEELVEMTASRIAESEKKP